MSEQEPTVPRQPRDPFAVLGVPRGATVDELRAAYRSRARRLHPDRHVQQDGTVAPEVHEAFCDLREAYDRVAATAPAPPPAPPPARVTPPVQPSAAMVPAQRGPRPAPARHADPVLALLTTPQRSRGEWSAEALEVWALTVVPAARRHLGDARRHAVRAGAADLRRLAAATAHAMLTLTVSSGLKGVAVRRLDALDEHLAAAYDALERELPPAVVERLPDRCERVARPGRGWSAILAR